MGVAGSGGVKVGAERVGSEGVTWVGMKGPFWVADMADLLAVLGLEIRLWFLLEFFFLGGTTIHPPNFSSGNA